jgi:Cof subfamily protein (haloacid dehalogenase superfamily)
LNDESLRELGKKIKVIICDLDQTLLNSEKKISRNNLKAIQAAQDKGVFVTISSGRIFTMLKIYEKELEINGPLITTNGAVIFDSRDDRVVWSRHIDRQISLEILNFAKDQGYDYCALTGKDCYFSPNSIRIQRFTQYNQLAIAQNLPMMSLVYLNGDNDVIEGEIYKILIDENQPGQIKEAFQFLKTFDSIDVTSSEKGLLDILPAGVNKGVGVRQLRHILGVQKEGICVFGDYLNDLPMFNEAGLSIAMDNAHQELKDNALVITDHYDDDGVAQAIHKYIL